MVDATNQPANIAGSRITRSMGAMFSIGEFIGFKEVLFLQALNKNFYDSMGG